LRDIIVAEQIGKCYGTFRALHNVSFHIQEGECFGFLGHNGAGKSTTMRMIYGLSTVDEGRLAIFDRPIRLTPPEIKKCLGIVPQEDNLDPDLTVLENLEVYGGLFGMSYKEARHKGRELLALMGLEEKETANVESLSGGLKRRLVIARALINDPQLIILDEPTTGLDPHARHLVWQKLRDLKNAGVTLILTTHYMEEAAQLCDRLVVMHEGLILATGSPQELVEKYVLPCVLEIRLPLHMLPVNLLEATAETGIEALQVVDAIFLYARSRKQLQDTAAHLGISLDDCFLRPANLEDVFLKLTGKGAERE